MLEIFQSIGSIDLINKIFLLPLIGILLLQITKNIPFLQYLFAIFIPILFITTTVQHEVIEPYYLVWTSFFNKFEIKFLFTPISKLFIIMVGTLWLLNNIYSIGYLKIKNIKFTKFTSLIFASISCVTLIGSSGNLITLFLFYEILTFITYFLVSFCELQEAKIAGNHYISTLFITSSCLFLIGIVLVEVFVGSTRFLNDGIFSFVQITQQNWLIIPVLLILFLYGCSKAATLPMHFWLPEAMIAHTPVSALLHAVAVVKSGIIALLYIIIYIFGIKFLEQYSATHPLASSIPKYLAGFSAIYASVMAIKKLEIKRILGYSTIGQLGYMVMIISSFHEDMPKILILQLIAHAVAKINMFFIAGFLYLKYKIKKVSEASGIGKIEPLVAFCLFISILSIIGIPPTAGIISKYNIILYCVKNEEFFILTIITISTILSCYYLLPMIYGIFFGTAITQPIDLVQEKKIILMKKYYISLYIPIVVTAILVIGLFFMPYNIIFS